MKQIVLFFAPCSWGTKQTKIRNSVLELKNLAGDAYIVPPKQYTLCVKILNEPLCFARIFGSY